MGVGEGRNNHHDCVTVNKVRLVLVDDGKFGIRFDFTGIRRHFNLVAVMELILHFFVCKST